MKRRNIKPSNQGFTPADGWKVKVQDENFKHLDFVYTITTKGIPHSQAKVLAEKRHQDRMAAINPEDLREIRRRDYNAGVKKRNNERFLQSFADHIFNIDK